VNNETIVIIPAHLAVWCVNCDQVSNSPGERCIACDAAGGLLNLAKVLGREESNVVAMEFAQQSN
jgi:hypothetical protein